MFSKPVIGLNANFRNATHDRPAFSFISAGYFDAVIAAGGIPVVLPPVGNAEDQQAVLQRLDGVVLIGGPDLDPNRDGFMRHASIRMMEPRREEADRSMMKMIAQMRLPVFGIGVGMQLINVAMGGNLFMHIPEDLPGALPHHDTIDKHHRHGLEVVPGTLMEKIFGDGEVRVNSSHHMAIDELAPGFIVSARSPDGVIEAIESAHDDWFAIGTQFHPEAESASALDQRIFEEFVEGVVAGKTGNVGVAAA
ncbi:gamma-glutamyl-gamma-aminobutyrate hydrolase family protein [Blastopirellula marina]|uniref:gamma-glutamyl-gamma-aminobutyrate hydrolase n=1 Tax=Blastopirellula marina TaxID=124 RepID=A0A2S8GE29_9BACT|nr:gamma-glutamyl-gamma-aminobutyrate hydrolase family protein [Blastopirellula marina]PQO42560.1 gamma-glutamyl-gamma-aminobutyrate hydrolase [Blastopirellula marina]PTL46326.1 gamma-glutamyl-gamma-aminobutyrate hydrolase [Blastopirellula marina]